MLIKMHFKAKIARRKKEAEIEEERVSHITMDCFIKSQVSADLYIHNMMIDKIYRSQEEKIILLQRYWRQYFVKPVRIPYRGVKLYGFAMLLEQRLKEQTPLSLAWKRLEVLLKLKKSQKEKKKKIAEKKQKLVKRGVQRQVVQVTKMNFVAGILNRFFVEYLRTYLCRSGGSAKNRQKFGGHFELKSPQSMQRKGTMKLTSKVVKQDMTIDQV